MRNGTGFGLVLYAKELPRLRDFYAGVTALPVVTDQPGRAVLGEDPFQLFIVQVPADWADGIVIADPPRRREETPMKPCFPVPSLEVARETARLLSGVVDGPEQEWGSGGWQVCDGADPEGNVFQLRAPAAVP